MIDSAISGFRPEQIPLPAFAGTGRGMSGEFDCDIDYFAVAAAPSQGRLLCEVASSLGK